MGLGTTGLGAGALGRGRAGAVADLTVAATIPQPTLAVSLSGFNDCDLSVAASIPLPVLAVSLSGFNDSDLTAAGTIPQPVVAVSLDVAPVNPQLTIAATIPQPVLALALAGFTASNLSLAATIPLPLLAVDLETLPALRVAATIPQPILDVDLTAGEDLDIAGAIPQPVLSVDLNVQVVYVGATDNRDEGIDLDGTALVEWEPAIVPAPAKYASLLAFDTARAIQLTGIGPAGQPLITKLDKAKVRAKDRILIGGVDFTYFRGVKTPTPDFRLIKPLLWGSATLVLPQINPQYELLGDDATVSALRRIKADTVVVVQRVLAGVVVATDYVGFIDAINTSGSTLSLTLGGHASGRASNDDEQPPVFRKKHDLKFQILNYLRTLNLNTAPDTDEIGIPIYDRGGSDGLSHINDLVSLAVTSTGVTYDVAPVVGRTYEMYETDRETIDATVYLDDSLATQQLDRAFSEEPNIVYATGRTPAGEVVNNAKAPGLVQHVPDFEITMALGDVGGNIGPLNNQLTIAGQLNYGDLDDVNVFSQDTEDAVVEFQEQAGLATVAAAGGFLGKVNELTWNRLWNLDVIGFTIDQARIFPMAQRSYTRQWNFSGNGSKVSLNEDWDPHRIKRAISIDVGSGFNRRRIKRFARSRLAPNDVSNWQGTLSLTSAVIAGEHTPGDLITADDVMPARALRPGMNIWLPLFDGGTLFHIATVDVTNDGANVELHIDTQARDSIPLWEVIARNRETRSSVARRVSGHVRASQVQQDSVAEWTDICGNIPAQQPLTGGRWNGVVVPAGQEGVVNRVHLQLESPAPFAVMLTQTEIPNGPNVATPLTDSRPDARPWYERAAVVNDLKSYGILDAWGTPDQPAGYDPGLKTDDQGATGDPLTGLLDEVAGLNYSASQPGRLFLYIWVAEDNFLEPGRLLRQQLTPGI